ncbi:hypothetical protein PCANC_16801 [Puccinia coronata f. sp. avenae]|uniref:Uncharacterized protein n=1 Tax=Puccinia coronata f. sp. avenae TaxID=200324 RepID=A0A2N5UP01_9BASI|nr:hypothetical protein PCASD_15249 [Puccinia coronata f. sp. avenae]PLW39485.1 hypothetical protein PCANC_16801 [Puccinia coronata f. sp. avenae]
MHRSVSVVDNPPLLLQNSAAIAKLPLHTRYKPLHTLTIEMCWNGQQLAIRICDNDRQLTIEMCRNGRAAGHQATHLDGRLLSIKLPSSIAGCLRSSYPAEWPAAGHQATQLNGQLSAIKLHSVMASFQPSMCMACTNCTPCLEGNMPHDQGL